MDERARPSAPVSTPALADHIGRKARRKLRARRWSHTNSVWAGLGMMGLVGWSVVLPALCGGAVGVWIDRRFDLEHRLTLPLLLLGLTLGCINAWRWVLKEDVAMAGDDDGAADDTKSTLGGRGE